MQTEKHNTGRDSAAPNVYEILRISQVLALTGYKRTAWYAAMTRGDAPRPVKLGPKASGWVRGEVEAYIKMLMAKRDAGGV